jgi:transposase
MTRAAKPRKRSAAPPQTIHKPRGVIAPRVQAVGPEHFGIVCVDCAKARSKWMLTDFYGRILVEATEVEHTQACFRAMIQTLRTTLEQAAIRDQIVVIERTGRYHRPIQRAFAQAGFEARIIHPLTTKQHRQPANPGNKTDETDLAAIQRGAVNGFGLLEPPVDPVSVRLQLLARHRRDLVEKTVALRCQIHEHLHAIMPGYSQCFEDICDCQIPLWVARQFGSAAAIVSAGVAGLIERLRQADIRIHLPTLEKIVAWARSAPAAEDESNLHLKILIELDDDRLSKVQGVRAIERELAGLLVQTPYVLLLGIPGINVVSAAEFAGEMGPIDRYPTGRAITGRAGLFASRYQSDRVDCPNGPLVRSANRNLRRAIMIIADNLIKCNAHFRVVAAGWRRGGRDPRAVRVQVAGRFCRIAYQMVAGGKVFRHPSCQTRDYVLKKLITFHNEHKTDVEQITRDLDVAVAQLPRSAYHEEALPLADELDRVLNQRGKGPRPLSEILPVVLAKLGVKPVRSPESGDAKLT